MSDNKDCHEFRFSIVRIIISVSNVTSPRIDKNLKIFQKSENPPKNLKISQKSENLSSVCALKCLYTQTYKCIQVLMFQHNYTKFLWQHLQKKILQWNNYIAQSASDVLIHLAMFHSFKVLQWFEVAKRKVEIVSSMQMARFHE